MSVCIDLRHTCICCFLILPSHFVPSAFRAILAEPRTKNSTTENDYFGNSRADHEAGMSGYPFSGTELVFINTPFFDSLICCATCSSCLSEHCFCEADNSNYTSGEPWSSSEMITRCLMMTSRAVLTQEQVHGLFDLIPGLEYCKIQLDQHGFVKGNSLV